MQDTSSKKISSDYTRAYYKSSSFKMAALFTILLGTSAILLAFFLYDYGQKNFLRETEATIDTELYHMLNIAENRGEIGLQKYIKARKKTTTVYLYQDLFAEVSIGDLEEMPAHATKIIEGVIGFSRKINGHTRFYAAKIHTFADGSFLLVARDVTDIRANHILLKTISTVIMIFMLMVILVSFVISNFVVSRINMIAATARNIMLTGDLSRRISIDTNWDDLSNLAQVLNGLLEKVEVLMTDVRSVSDNIAHDLRTPLTRLRNELQRTKKQSTVTQNDMDLMIAEADHLLATFSSLLRITNIEKAKRHQALSSTNLSSVLQDVAELYEPLAEDKDITFEEDIEADLTINGDGDLLFQLFANLLDNAVKYSNSGGHIFVSLEKQKNEHKIIISDTGIGISEEEKAKVFERFYRTDKSRSQKGTGLGLSLAKAILELHNATIELKDNAPGLRVEITI